ncbi:MAG: hypothetical protein V4671_30375 [Armatimonadota bacterium]
MAKAKADSLPVEAGSALREIRRLTDIVDAIPESKTPEHEIDISKFFPSGAKVTITWRSPNVKQIYCIENDARELRQRFMHWEPQMAIDVAAMAACHVVEERDMAPGLFYAALCEKSRDLWIFLVSKLNEVFPELKGVNNQDFFTTIFDLAAEFYHVHPTHPDCERLDAKVITELIAAKNRKIASTNLG